MAKKEQVAENQTAEVVETQSTGLEKFIGKYVFVNFKHNNYQVVKDAQKISDTEIQSNFLVAKSQAMKANEFRLIFVEKNNLDELKILTKGKTEVF